MGCGDSWKIRCKRSWRSCSRRSAYIDNGKGYAAKVGDGLEALANVTNFIPAAYKINEAVRAYDTVTAKEFVTKYAPDFDRLTTAVSNIFDNISRQPIETGAAMLTCAAAGYALSRAIGFWQHKGQGGYMTRLERRVGERIWPEPKKTAGLMP